MFKFLKCLELQKGGRFHSKLVTGKHYILSILYQTKQNKTKQTSFSKLNTKIYSSNSYCSLKKIWAPIRIPHYITHANQHMVPLLKYLLVASGVLQIELPGLASCVLIIICNGCTIILIATVLYLFLLYRQISVISADGESARSRSVRRHACSQRKHAETHEKKKPHEMEKLIQTETTETGRVSLHSPFLCKYLLFFILPPFLECSLNFDFYKFSG